jgi:biopolymer transport protein ExbB
MAEDAGSTAAGAAAGGGAPSADALGGALSVLDRGGAALWVIAALSVLTVALVLWKTWRLLRDGAWRRARAEAAVAAWRAGRADEAVAIARAGRGIAAETVAAALAALHARALGEEKAREETTRVARARLGAAGRGLRALDVIATIAPLVGLLGTVLGMIAAFQAFEATGGQATPGDLAGGIWEALLTTAAGMAVAIPASVALAWFESVLERLARDLEDLATRIFTHVPAAAPAALAEAAE